MDEELRAMLEAAHSQGASDDDLKRLIDLYEADKAQQSSGGADMGFTNGSDEPQQQPTEPSEKGGTTATSWVGDEEMGYSDVDPSKYETKLSPEEESKFQTWLDQQHKEGKIQDGDYRFYKDNGYGYGYDFRAAYKKGESASINPVDNKWHWGDTGKKPNHPTFSDQSKYHGVDGYIGGKWGGQDGEEYTPPHPSKTDGTESIFKVSEEPIDLPTPTKEEKEAGVTVKPKVEKKGTTLQSLIQQEVEKIPEEERLSLKELEESDKRLKENVNQLQAQGAMPQVSPTEQNLLDRGYSIKKIDDAIAKRFPILADDKSFTSAIKEQGVNNIEFLERVADPYGITDEEALEISANHLINRANTLAAEIQSAAERGEEITYGSPRISDNSKVVLDYMNTVEKYDNLMNQNKALIDKIKEKREEIDRLNQGGEGTPSIALLSVSKAIPGAFAQDFGSRLLNGLENVSTDFLMSPASLASLMEEASDWLFGEEDKYTIVDKILDFSEREFKSPLTVSERQFYKDGNIDFPAVLLQAADQVGTFAALAAGNYASGLKAANTLRTTKGLQAARKGIDLLQKQQNISTVVGGYVVSLESNRREAKEMGLSGANLVAYTNFMSLLEGASELIMPDNKILSPDIKDIALKTFIGNLSKGRRFATKEALKTVGEVVGKENLEELLVLVGKTLQTSALALENKDIDVYLPEIEEVINTVASTTVLSGTSGIFGAVGTSGRLRNQAILKGSENIEMTQNIVQQYVNKGIVSTKDANEFLAQVAIAKVAKSEIPISFSDEDAADVLTEAEQLTNLREEAKTKQGVAKEQINEEIKRLEEVIRKKSEERKAEPTTVEAQAPQVEEDQATEEQATQEVDEYITNLTTKTEEEVFGDKTVVDGVLDKMNNAEYINDTEIDQGIEAVFNEIDRVNALNISDKAKNNITDKLYNIAEQLDNYEFRTKTITSEVTTEKSTKSGQETKREIPQKKTKASVNGVNSEVTFLGEGKVSIVQTSQSGTKSSKTTTVTFPENFLYTDENGDFSAVEMVTEDGQTVTITDPEVGIPLAVNNLIAETAAVPTEVVTELVTEEVNYIKEGKDAVQEQTTDEVPVQPETETGKEVQEGKPESRPEEVAEEGQEETQEVTPQQYVEELNKTKESDPETYWTVDSVSEKDASEGTIVGDKDGYGVVSKDGDIKGVFKALTSKAKNVADKILQAAVKAGGIKLDNFDNYLSKIYKRNGFRVVARIPFNEEYAPDGWNRQKHGTPDVVAMVYDPEGKLDIEERTFDDYDEAIAYRDSFVEQARALQEEAPQTAADKFRNKFGAVVPAKIQKAVDRALKSLAKIAPDLEIIIASTPEEFAILGGDRGAFAGGKIYINPQKANARTVAHEVFHALLFRDGKTEAEAKRITDRMMESIRKTASPELLKQLDDFSSMYEDALQSEESIAELFGIIAEAYENMDGKSKSTVRKWLNNLIKVLGLDKLVGDMITQSDKEVLEFLNSVAKKVALGEEITQSDVKPLGTKESQAIASDIKRFHADYSDSVSKLTFEYDVNTDTFKKLERDGYITKDKSIVDFNGKYVILHQPDAAFSGFIYKTIDGKRELLVEGKGGVYYPIKFHEDGYFWASTSGTAEKMAEDLNKLLKQNNGVIYMALTSAPSDKLLSSTTMSNAVLDFFLSKAVDKSFKLTEPQLKKALIKAAGSTSVSIKVNKKTGKVTKTLTGLGIKLTAKDTIPNISSIIKTKLSPDNSTFNDRKHFVTELVKELSDNINKNQVSVEQFGKLFSEGIQNKYFKGITKTGKISISKANMVQALSEMFTEPLLKEGINRDKGGQVYAILELNSGVKPIKSGKHESYPMAIVTDNPSIKTKLHILTDRPNWYEVTEDFETNEIVRPDRFKRVYPSYGVSVRGLKINTSNYQSKTQESVAQEAVTRKQKVEKVQDETNFVPVSFWVESLKGNVDYLDNVIEHILKAREILKSGKVPQRMTTKSYLITLASMGSGGGYYENWKTKTNKTVDSIFIEKQNGRDWLRPEGAAAAFLSTDKGKTLVDKINKGTATKEEIKEIFDFVGTGRESSKADYVVSTIQSGGLKAMTDTFNSNKGSDFSELFASAIKNLKGIGEGKTGFFNQYFGVSSRGVVDARQMNAWTAGSMKLTDEQKRLKKKIESSPKLQAELLKKIEEVGLELGYPEDLAAYIAHHAIWDGIANNITRHEGEYLVTRKQQPARPTIQEVLDFAKQEGISKADTRAYLKELGYTTAEINTAMPRQVRPPSARRITGQPKPKKVTVQEMSALKSQIRMEAKAAKGAVAEINRIRRGIQEQLNNLVRAGKISTKQLNSILKKLNRMNLLNPVMRERFIKYMDKVYANAEYAAKLTFANSARNKIKKGAKSKNVDAVLSQSAKLFAEVDPLLVEDIDAYNEMAEKVLSGLTSSKVGKAPRAAFNVNEVNSYAGKEVEAQNKIRLQAFKESFEEITGIDPKDMTYSEMMSLLEEPEDSNLLDAKRKQARDIAEAYFKAYTGIIEQMLRGVDPFTGEALDINPRQAEVMKQFLKLDLNNFTTKELVSAVDILNNFATNLEVGGAEKILNNKKGVESAKSIKVRVKKSINFLFNKTLGRSKARYITTLPLLFEQKFGGFTEGQKVMDAMGLQKLINASNRVKKIVDNLIEGYYKKFEKTKPNGEAFNSVANNIERGVYAAMRRTVNGTEAEQNAEFNRKKKLIKDSIEKLNSGNESQRVQAQAVEAAYIKLLAAAQNISDVEAKVDPINKQAVEYWTEEFAKIKPQLDDVSLSMYNTLLEDDIFYTPDTYKKVESVDQIIDDKESSYFAINGKGVIAPGKAGQLKQVNRPKTLKDRYISLDFDTNMANAMTAGLMDVNTAPSISFIKGFMGTKDAKAMFGTQEDYELFTERINDYIQGVRGRKRFDSDRELSRMLSIAGKIGTAKALGGLTQPLKQVLPVVTNTLLNAGGSNFYDALELFHREKGINEMINNSGYAIANRGASARLSIESMNSQVDKMISKTTKGTDLLGSISEKILEKFLVEPDVAIARASWLAYYIQNLKKQGVDTAKINWSNHKMNDTAAEYAQGMVDRQQNISDEQLQGKLFTSSSNSTRLVKNVAFPFMTFILNQKERMYSDISVILSKTASKEDKAIALRSALGMLAELATYSAIRYTLSLALFEAAAAIIGYDEPEEEEKIRKEYLRRGIVTNFASDIFSPMPPVTDPVLMGMINAVADGVSGEDVVFEPRAKGIAEGFGSYGIGLTRLLEVYEVLDMAYDGKYTKESFGRDFEVTLTNKQKDGARIGAALQLAHLMGMPTEFNTVGKNITKIVKKDAAKYSKKKDKDKKNQFIKKRSSNKFVRKR